MDDSKTSAFGASAVHTFSIEKLKSEYVRSLKEPEKFWAERAERFVWEKKWNSVMDQPMWPFIQWFKGGQFSLCYNCIDRHVNEGRGDKIALIYDSPLPSSRKVFTYSQLLEPISRLAGYLVQLGLKKGDTVMIYVPNVPEGVIAKLAVNRIGAKHYTLLGEGFAAAALKKKIEMIQPLLVITVNATWDKEKEISYKATLDEALEELPEKYQKIPCILVQRPQFTAAEVIPGRDHLWEDAIQLGQPHPCVSLEANDATFLLSSSGSSGVEKVTTIPHAGFALSTSSAFDYIGLDWSDDVYWINSNLGWIAGLIGIVYGTMLRGITTVLFEGSSSGTPDASVYYRIVAENGVKVIAANLSYLRALRLLDPDGSIGSKFKFDKLQHIGTGGEPHDPVVVDWATKVFGVPVFQIWGQTELGGFAITSLRGEESIQKPLPNGVGYPLPGYDFLILNDDDEEARSCEQGRIVLRLPILNPGFTSGYYQDPEKLVKDYFINNKYLDTKDLGYIDELGSVHVQCRTDDMIKVDSHRIGTISIEKVIAKHKAVGSCIVFGIGHEKHSFLPLALVVVLPGTSNLNEIRAELLKLVLNELGEAPRMKFVVFVNDIPKGSSGKLDRGSVTRHFRENVEKIMNDETDEAAMNRFKQALKSLGIITIE